MHLPPSFNFTGFLASPSFLALLRERLSAADAEELSMRALTILEDAYMPRNKALRFMNGRLVAI